jgi:hypothetical protein
MPKRLSATGATLVMAALALAGCASGPPTTTAIPIATAYPASNQPKMQAAQHWAVLANDIAAQVAPSAKSAGRSLYVAQQAPSSHFYEGFRGMLEEALVNQGASVSASPAGALTLNYRVQIVAHQTPRRGFAGPGSDSPTQAEAIVTAEIVDAGRVAYKTNRVYYVNPDDAIAQYVPVGKPVIQTQPRPVRVRN